jgi:flagellar basal-body rod modification protein FlgD
MTAIPQTTSDYNAFLKLMTAQMKYQDPLAPLDATQFVTQLAQFSQVEQSVQMNSKLDGLTGAIANLSSQTAVSLIGRQVEVQGNAVTLKDGGASFAVTLDDTPEQAIYVIADAQGNIVRHGEFTYSGDRHTIEWDGKNNSGVAVDDGAYRIEVIAADENGNSIPARTFINQTIAQVIQSGGATNVLLDNGQTIDINADMRIS